MMKGALMNFLRGRWAVWAMLGLALVLFSLALLAFALSPAPDPLRAQATLAPTWFVPPVLP